MQLGDIISTALIIAFFVWAFKEMKKEKKKKNEGSGQRTW